VLDSCDWLEREGWRVTRLGVGADGLVDLDEAEALIGADTALVAAMLVNNEIGVVQPIAALARMARRAGALMFCDAVQGFGRVPVPVADCDLVALSAYKIYGPKGDRRAVGGRRRRHRAADSTAAGRSSAYARVPCRRPSAPGSAPPRRLPPPAWRRTLRTWRLCGRTRRACWRAGGR
jgi:hypothetical protein